MLKADGGCVEGGTHRKVLTLMLILVWIAMGLTMEIGGPTMLDLRLRFQTDSETVARSMSAAGAGIFLGALFAGLFVDNMGPWKDVLVGVSQLVGCLVTVCMPYAGNMSAIWFMFFVAGAATGLTNVAGQRILLDLWQQKAAAPMHALHMGFGIGAVAAPLIANNFLAVLDFNIPPDNSTSPINVTENGDDKFIVVKESRVQYAFVTIGILSMVISLPIILHPFYKLYLKRYCQNKYLKIGSIGASQKSERICDMLNPGTYADGSKGFGTFVFIVVFLFFFNAVGGEQLYGNFVRTFSVDQLKFTRNEASYLDMAYWGCFTLGRLVGSILSHFLPIRSLFLMDALLYLISVTLLDILSSDNHGILWMFTAVVGFMVAPLFPACVSFTNTQIEVGGIVLTLILFATGFGDLIYIWIAGVVYQKHGPRTLLYVLQVAATATLVITIIFVVSTRKRPDRFKRIKQRESCETSPISESMEISEPSYTEHPEN